MSTDFITRLVNGGLTDAVSVTLHPGSFVLKQRIYTEESAFREALKPQHEGKYVIVLPNRNESRVIVASRIETNKVVEAPLIIAPHQGVFYKALKGVPTRLVMMRNSKYRLWLEKTNLYIPVIMWSYFLQNAIRLRSFYTNAFDFFRCRSHQYTPQFGRVTRGATIFALDAEYNNVTRQGLDEKLPVSVEIPWTPPTEFSPEDIDVPLAHIFYGRLDAYFNAPRRPEPTDNMSRNIIGEYQTDNDLEALMQAHVPGRHALSPERWLTVLRPKAVVYPFPKNGCLRSDGTPRTIYSMDVSYEAYLRLRYGLHEHDSDYARSHIIPASTFKLESKYRYSYDVIHCDEQVMQYLAGNPKYTDLLPYTCSGGSYYKSSAFPSGILLTSAITQVFVESLLARNGVHPDDVVISGDGFMCTYPPIIVGANLRRSPDRTLSGFDFTTGSRRYLRGHRLTDVAYLRRNKVSGRLLWLIRYRCYTALDCVNLPHNSVYVQTSFAHGRVADGLYVHEMSTRRFARLLSEADFDVGNLASIAFGIPQRKRGQNSLDSPYSGLYAHAVGAVPEEVLLRW